MSLLEVSVIEDFKLNRYVIHLNSFRARMSLEVVVNSQSSTDQLQLPVRFTPLPNLHKHLHKSIHRSFLIIYADDTTIPLYEPD